MLELLAPTQVFKVLTLPLLPRVKITTVLTDIAPHYRLFVTSGFQKNHWLCVTIVHSWLCDCACWRAMTEPTFLTSVSNVVLIATVEEASDWLGGENCALIGPDKGWLCSCSHHWDQTSHHLSPSKDPWDPKCELVWCCVPRYLQTLPTTNTTTNTTTTTTPWPTLIWVTLNNSGFCLAMIATCDYCEFKLLEITSKMLQGCEQNYTQ